MFALAVLRKRRASARFAYEMKKQDDDDDYDDFLSIKVGATERAGERGEVRAAQVLLQAGELRASS